MKRDGKKNPVTLVNTVVARNGAAHPDFLAPKLPNRTMSPETVDQAQDDVTCVKVSADNPGS
jgi:hypothetical protein